MKIKAFRLGKELLKELAETGSGSAVFATLNVKDHDGEVTLPGAFGVQTAFLVPAHNWHGTLPPFGKGVSREEGGKAIVDFILNPDTQGGKEWRAHLKFDLENGTPKQEWSYGFDVLESEKGEFEGETVDFLKRIGIHEFSPVLLGAGIETSTLEVKDKKSNLTLTNHFETVGKSLIETTELLGRCRSLADRRAKEGRNLSEANRTKLAILLKNLADIEGGLTELLKDTTPQQETSALLLEQFKSTLTRFTTVLQ